MCIKRKSPNLECLCWVLGYMYWVSSHKDRLSLIRRLIKGHWLLFLSVPDKMSLLLGSFYFILFIFSDVQVVCWTLLSSMLRRVKQWHLAMVLARHFPPW